MTTSLPVSPSQISSSIHAIITSGVRRDRPIVDDDLPKIVDADRHRIELMVDSKSLDPVAGRNAEAGTMIGASNDDSVGAENAVTTMVKR
jgi:hypothetical protein